MSEPATANAIDDAVERAKGLFFLPVEPPMTCTKDKRIKILDAGPEHSFYGEPVRYYHLVATLAVRAIVREPTGVLHEDTLRWERDIGLKIYPARLNDPVVIAHMNEALLHHIESMEREVGQKLLAPSKPAYTVYSTLPDGTITAREVDVVALLLQDEPRLHIAIVNIPSAPKTQDAEPEPEA